MQASGCLEWSNKGSVVKQRKNETSSRTSVNITGKLFKIKYFFFCLRWQLLASCQTDLASGGFATVNMSDRE